MKYTTCFLFITIFLLNHFVGFSQKQKDTTNTYKYYARQQLDTLKKQGAVIILLKSKTRAMEAYEKAGNLKLVNELTEKMNKQNIQMVKSYSKYWNFCPYYFLYLSDLADFNKGKRSNIFVDSTLQKNESITMTETYFIFLDFGPYYEVQSLPNGKWKPDPTKNIDPNEGTPVRQNCIVAKDREMNQFREPFPCYAQTWNNEKRVYIDKKNNTTMISDVNKPILNLNSRFHYFYENGKDVIDYNQANITYQSPKYFLPRQPFFYK